MRAYDGRTGVIFLDGPCLFFFVPGLSSQLRVGNPLAVRFTGHPLLSALHERGYVGTRVIPTGHSVLARMGAVLLGLIGPSEPLFLGPETIEKFH